jgi:hypothetical protein
MSRPAILGSSALVIVLSVSAAAMAGGTGLKVAKPSARPSRAGERRVAYASVMRGFSGCGR